MELSRFAAQKLTKVKNSLHFAKSPQCQFTFISENDSPPIHVSELDVLEGDGEGGSNVRGDPGSIFISSLISHSETNIIRIGPNFKIKSG